MTPELDCLNYAAAHPDVEVCGLIIDGQRLFPCRNTHADPANHFRIDALDWILAEEQGEITAIFHSHINGTDFLTGADRRAQVQTGLDWWLVQGGQLRKFRPVPHLLGRSFDHGKIDCYALFRDAYHLAGIDMPDFERTDGWWKRGENLYLKNFEATGFHRVDASEAQPGDVLLIQAMTWCDPCHSMILLDDNTVLHHDNGQLVSRREPLRPAYVKTTHSIWRHEQCSSLNLRAVYADISARSF